jgi:hypothetical protein
MCWQHDYTVTRNEGGSDDSKLGGSGGGGKAQQSSSISYDYKWDMVFHLAMVPTKVNLIKGWLGPDRLNDETVRQIIASNAGAIEYVGGDSHNSEQDKVSMRFQDAFFYKGSGPGLTADDPTSLDAGWDEIAADEGVPVRWPHTAWVGFKQLDLGQSPSVPQMSFEIGPGDAAFNYEHIVDTYFDSVVEPHIVTGGTPFFTGDDGKTYCLHSKQDSYRIYRRAGGAGTAFAFVQQYTSEQLDEIVAAYSPNLANLTSSTFQYIHLAVAHPYNYIIAVGTRTTFPFNGSYAVVFKINSAGSLECVGYQFFDHINIASGIYRPSLITLVDNKTMDSGILVVYNGIPFSSNYLYAYFFPSLNQLIGSDAYVPDGPGPGTMDVNRNQLGDSDGLGDFGNQALDTSRFAWTRWFALPYFTGDVELLTGEPIYGTRIYSYVGEADIELAPSNTFISTYGALYPTGFIFYLDLGVMGEFDPALIDGPMDGVTYTAVIANADFVDGANVSVIPFSDRSLNADGVTYNATVPSDYYPAPSVIELTSGPNAGTFLVTFSQTLTDDSSRVGNQASPYSTYARGRVFAYSKITGKFTQITAFEGEPYNRSQFGDGTTDEVNYQFSMFAYMPDTEEMYFLHHLYDYTPSFNVRHEVIGRFGSFAIVGGEDVYPPYIIYELLANPFLGIGLTDDMIDQDSYQETLDYCELNNFKVSAQFRREQGTLATIDDVLTTYGGFLSISNGVVKFKRLEYLDGAASPVRTIDNHHLIVEQGKPPVSVTKGALQDTFNKIRVNYFDRNLEYAQNQVEEADEVDQDLNGIRMREYPAIFVMQEGMARTMAVRALWTNLYARDTYDFSLGWKDQDLEPGDVITLQDSYHPALANGVIARIISWKENKRGKFDISAKQEFEYMLASSGDTLDITSASFTSKAGAMPVLRDFSMYEVPAAMDTEPPHIFVGWSTWNFAAGAELYASTDGVTYARALRVDPYQIAATLIGGLPDTDEVAESVEVVMYPTSDYYSTGSVFFEATLGAAGQESRAAGAATMLVGSEMIAYEGVTLVSQNRYRFDKVFRGWGGTIHHEHSSGDQMFKHGGGVFKQDIAKNKIGTTIYYKVKPYNFLGVGPDISSINAKSYVIKGTGWLPSLPADVRFVNSYDHRGLKREWVGSEVDINLAWNDTSTIRGFGILGNGYGGYGDFTPGSYSFRVEVYNGSGSVVRSLSVTSNNYTYSIADNVSDNGAWKGNCAFKVTPYNEIGDALASSVCSLELWK